MSKGITFFFSASVVLGIAVAGGCGSSSANGQNPGNDASPNDGSAIDDASDTADGAVPCAIGPNPGCATGETCCFDPRALANLANGGLPDLTQLRSLTQGYCTTSCGTGFSLGCAGSATCGAEKCCATVTTPPGLLDAAADFDGNFAFDGSFAGFDASGFPGAGAAGGSLVVDCAATCEGMNHLQLCASSSECPSDLVCSAGTGLAAMFFGGLKACIRAPEAGVGSDAGPVDAGSATDGPSDSGTTAVDAGPDAADSAL